MGILTDRPWSHGKSKLLRSIDNWTKNIYWKISKFWEFLLQSRFRYRIRPPHGQFWRSPSLPSRCSMNLPVANRGGRSPLPNRSTSQHVHPLTHRLYAKFFGSSGRKIFYHVNSTGVMKKVGVNLEGNLNWTVRHNLLLNGFHLIFYTVGAQSWNGLKLELKWPP